MTTTPPEPPAGGYDPNAGAPPGYGAPPPPGAPPPGYGAPPATGAWMGPPLADWPLRVGAALVDAAIIYVPGLILGKIAPVLGLLFEIAAWLYLMYMQGTTGQTFGKQVLKIKLLREQDGQVVGFGMAVVRAIAHIVDGIPCGVGYLWPLWDKKKQTFADKILQTVVIKV